MATEAKSVKGKVDGGWVALLGALVTTFLYLYYNDGSAVYTLGWLSGFKKGNFYRVWEEYLLVSAVVLLWVPMLYITVFTKHELGEYGFARGNVKQGWAWAGIMFAAMIVPLIFASRRPEFQSYYPLQKQALTNIRYLIYFELTYGFYLFCWEFFFRGFLTFGLYRWIGNWGILAQACAFTVLHLGKPPLEVAGSFIAAIILGCIALRAKSFLPAFWAHWGVALTLDLLIVFGRHH
ncbi:MAG: CPBP family intramembrane glutamic endopeptidase [bacterium]